MKTILGTGIFNLDKIYVREYPLGPSHNRTFNETFLKEEAGGTCGNIMCMLAHYGWKTYPLAKLDNSADGHTLAGSLKSFGCDCRFVSNSDDGGTTYLTVTHKLDESGNKKVSVRAGSTDKDGNPSRFPRRRYLKVRNEAPAFIEALDLVPDVFFFDDPAAAHRLMAKELRSKGSLVYFEPNAIKTNADLTSVEHSDIVKFSEENIPDISFTDNYTDKLFIQTRGSEGLRFNLRGEGWVNLPPVHNDNFVDWEGAGDWTTSTFLKELGDIDALSIDKLTSDTVRSALQKAQAVASKSVSYLGSKGMIQ